MDGFDEGKMFIYSKAHWLMWLKFAHFMDGKWDVISMQQEEKNDNK